MNVELAITGLIVLAASVYLIRRSILVFRGSNGRCGGCPRCPSGSESDQLPVRKQLYTLGSSRNPHKPH